MVSVLQGLEGSIAFFSNLSGDQRLIVLAGVVVILSCALIAAIAVILTFKINRIKVKYEGYNKRSTVDINQQVYYGSLELLNKRVKKNISLEDETDYGGIENMHRGVQAQVDLAELTLRVELITNNTARAMIKIRENGFYKMKGEELEKYIVKNGGEIFREAVTAVLQSPMNKYPLLTREGSEFLYLEKDAIDKFREVILQAKYYHNKEVKEIMGLIVPFMNFFIKFISKD